MTVIVGLETTVGEKAVVVGSDRSIVSDDRLIRGCINHIVKNPYHSISNFFHFLQEKGLDKVKLSPTRKIQTSDDKRVLAHTGSSEESHNQISKLLLKTEDFLKEDSLLKQILFPIGCSKELANEYLRIYKRHFNIDQRLCAKHIPEIRRIFDIHTAKLRTVNAGPFSIALWDRNYHPVLSEYLFAKLFEGEPKLFEITKTGVVTTRQYFVKGSGRPYAFQHIRYRLETSEFPFLYASETGIEKPVDLEMAVKVVRESIEYANYCSPFCKGFDYAIFTRDKIEEHFSNEKFSYELNIIDLIDKRLNELLKEQNNLKKIKARYLTN